MLLLRPGDGAALSLVDDATHVWRSLGNSRAETRLAAARSTLAEPALFIQTLGGFRVLRAAETAYTGDFLEEDPYEDWASELREEARLTYVQVATVLGGHTSDLGEHITASRYCLRVLERDQYNEPAHLALVRARRRHEVGLWLGAVTFP